MHASMSGILRSFRRCSSSASSDASSAFFSEVIQKELKALTGINYDKVFSVNKIGSEIKAPTYQFLTSEELQEKLSEARRKAEAKLHMPPVMNERKPISKVIESDPGLKGLNVSKYVFTDISFGIHDRERIITVREPNGDLRTAEWEERDRLNQIYFPKPGRRSNAPPMFRSHNLKNILTPSKYEYILAKNCEQFEPDHPTYLRTAEAVYDHVDQNREYDVLLSSRFFGPMIYTLAAQSRIDNILIHYFNKKDPEGAGKIIRVFAEVQSLDALRELERNGEELIRLYMEKYSSQKNKVNMAYDTMVEIMKKDHKALEDKKRAHGVSTDQNNE